jgi:carboxymethylenebutenolidase
MYLGTRARGLAAIVTFYGSGLITDPAEMGLMADNGPVLGIFGEDDGSIPLREVEAFESALDDIGVDSQITVYPGVGHAFVKSSTFQNDGPAGQAWRELLDFLTREL